MTADTTPKDADALLRDLLKREPGVFTGAEENALRAVLAEREQLRDEYGIRVTFTSTRTVEAAVGVYLVDALEALDRFDPEHRTDVVSRETIQRKVGDWRKAGGER